MSIKRIPVAAATLTLALAACGGDSSESDATNETTEAASGDTTTESSAAPDEESDEPSSGPDEINVAYFAQWPTPNQAGQEDGSFSEAVGTKVNWVPFNSGGEMGEAMESGDIDIAYSQGLTPFANFVNNGADLKMVGVAVSYAEADNCVAQGELGVTPANAAEKLAGTRVMTPIGNVTHYKMLSMMEHLGVSLDELEIVPAEGGATTAAAFESGQIDVGCAFGGAVVEMLNAGGELIMTGAEHEDEIGIHTYDVISIPADFGEQHPDTVTAFLAATEQFNREWEADPESMNPAIAGAAGMEDVGDFLAGEVWFKFPTVEDQLSEDWMNGAVQADMKNQLDTFVRLGEIPSVIDDFSGAVDTSYLEAAEQ